MTMSILKILAVTFFAGMGAGLGTGFAGMSAAAVISPVLIEDGSVYGSRHCSFF